MNYSAFEQAAAEASIGMREVDSQMEQLKAQLDQLKSRRDLLYTVSCQLMTLRPEGPGAGPAATPSDGLREMAAEPPAPEQPLAPFAAGEGEAEMAGVYSAPRPTRQGWFTRHSDPGTNGAAGDSSLRGRL